MENEKIRGGARKNSGRPSLIEDLDFGSRGYTEDLKGKVERISLKSDLISVRIPNINGKWLGKKRNVLCEFIKKKGSGDFIRSLIFAYIMKTQKGKEEFEQFVRDFMRDNVFEGQDPGQKIAEPYLSSIEQGLSKTDVSGFTVRRRPAKPGLER